VPIAYDDDIRAIREALEQMPPYQVAAVAAILRGRVESGMLAGFPAKRLKVNPERPPLAWVKPLS
jgi:hypothetical protein